MKMFFTFAMLFNICYANNNSFKDKPRSGATYLLAVLNSHRSEAPIFMKLIPLSKKGKNAGKYFAMVDDEDYEWLNRYTWCVGRSGDIVYALTSKRLKDGGVWRSSMHKLIANPPSGFIIDHKDRNGLNNQRENIRICTHAQNNCNKKALGKSKYLGVHHRDIKSDGKVYHYWVAVIWKNNKSISLGGFPSTPEGEIMAAKAYDEAAKKLHGEFANLNFK